MLQFCLVKTYVTLIGISYTLSAKRWRAKTYSDRLTSSGEPNFTYSMQHRRRIYTEEKSKFVAASWRTELLQFLAALAILHQDILKNMYADLHQDELKNRVQISLLFNLTFLTLLGHLHT